MARYNTFRYGDGTLYGAEAAPGATDSRLLWSVIVDWDGDGYFSGDNEAEYMVNFSLTRGRDAYLNPDGQGFVRYGTGKATLILDNSTGRYNSFNTSSPLYPYVTPGKRARLAVMDRTTGTDHELMRGNVTDIQDYYQNGQQMVKVEIADGQQFLKGRTIQIGKRQGGLYSGSGAYTGEWTTGSWVDLILQRAGWPDTEWPRTYDLLEDQNGIQLGVGTTENFYRPLVFAWFWLRDARDAVEEMENTELGTFLHARDGSARFLSSHFTYDQVIDFDESELLRDISTPQPWETIKNKIQVRVYNIYAGAGLETVWQVGGLNDEAIIVGPEGSRVFEAEFRFQNRKIVPTNYGISFTVNANRLGTGTDLTSSCRVQISEIADGATITLLNDSAAYGYITNLSVTGYPLYARHTTFVTAEDATSQGIYGLRSFQLESPWLQEFDWSDEIKAMLLNVLKDPTRYPIIKIENRPDKQFGLDLYVDAIHLVSGTLSINAFYRIGKIEHRWLNATGNAVQTTLKLEPYFAFDAQAEFDFDLLSPLDSSNPGAGTSLEIGCTGSAPAGRLKFCLEETIPSFEGWKYIDGSNDHTYGDFELGGLNGYIRGEFNGGNEADAASQNLSYTIVSGGALVFWYQWQDTNSESASDQPVTIILTTTESGAIVTEFLPFEIVTGVGDWTQYVIDLSAYAGETLTSIIFRKPSTYNSVADPILRIDDIGLGKLIYDGSN